MRFRGATAQAVIIGFLVMVCIELLAAPVLASTAAPGLTVNRNPDPKIMLGPGGGLLEWQILNLGERSRAASNALPNNLFLKTASVDTMRAGTAKKTRVVYSGSRDSLLAGTNVLGRSMSVLYYSGTASNIDAGDIRLAGRDIFGTKVVEIYAVTDNTVLSKQGIRCMAYLDSVTIPAAAADNNVVLYVGRGAIIQVPFTGPFTAPVVAIWEGGARKYVSTTGMVDSDSCYASATDISQNGICIQQTNDKNSVDYEILYWLPKYQSATAPTKW